MGTVGLSFGSPTSGAGFDVSSTVAEIVGNLQNVETPWKSQLTSLESQDAAISNLGTLFSNLSNDMSSLTDFQGIMAQKEGSSSDTSVLELMNATSSAATGTYSVVVNSLATTANGYLDSIAKSSDTLTGSITINGTAVNVPDSSTGNNTLSGLASAINSASIGVTASVVTDANGSRLSLVSNTSGASGSLSVTSAIDDGSTALNYNSNLATGANASLSVNGVTYSAASNSVSTIIPGVTFQLLGKSSSGSEVQVVIANDNSDVESTVNQFVTDYNSLISAINTQEGNDSSGNAEPLFGSPTLTLLQQELLSGLNTESPNGYVDSISSTNGTFLADQSAIKIQTGDGSSANFIVGSGSDSAMPGTYYTDNTDSGGVDNGNTLAGLAATINAVSVIPLLGYSGTAGTDATDSAAATTSSGTLPGIPSESDALTGSISIQVGSGTAQAIDVPATSGDNTLTGLMDAINNAGIGVTASIVQNSGTGFYSLSLVSGTSGSAGTLTVTSSVLDTNTVGATAGVSTSNGESTLALTSGTAGTNGALTVTSALTASTPAALGYTEGNYTGGQDSGEFGTVKSSSDTLAGSMNIQVGSGSAQTITLDSSDNTLSGLMSAINNANIGVQASLNTDGTALVLTSDTSGSTGMLTVTSNIYDTSDIASSTHLNYNSSSDINSLTDLGISVNDDGSLTFDANSLDSLLNTDYSSVVGFFQNANGWGQTFANMLTNAGTSSSTGILALASSSNSSIESTLNAEISKEQSYISAQQISLTAELNSANEIMQELPSQLNGMNELYSAITGYDENLGG